MEIKGLTVTTETLSVMNGEKEVRKMCSVIISDGTTEVRITSGESTIAKLEKLSPTNEKPTKKLSQEQ